MALSTPEQDKQPSIAEAATLIGKVAQTGGEGVFPTAESSPRILWPDFIRVVAVLAVTVLHVAAVPVTQYGFISASDWWWTTAFDSLVRPCVPLFVMLSGALLLTHRAWNVSRFVRQRLVRVAILFVAWSAIYAVWNYFFHGVKMSLGEFLRHLISGTADPVYTHLWYLPLILSLYLLIPILRIYVGNARLWNQLYFACLWLIATIAMPIAESRLGMNIGYSLTPVFGYVGYFVLGATLCRYVPPRLSLSWQLVSGIAFLIGYAITTVGTYLLAAQAGHLDEYFYSNLSPNVIVMSIAAFVLLREWGIDLEKRLPISHFMRRFLRLASAATIGIYLIHMMVLEVLACGVLGFTLGPLAFHPALAVPLNALVVFLLSLAATLSIQRIAALRWLVT
jgi:surface polysaccharide O-acyltransferase-like enzyme